MTGRPLGSVRPDGRGRWIVQVSQPTVDGGRRRLTRRVTGTRRDAERVRQQLLVEAGSPAAASTTVAAYLADRWLPHAAGKVRARTLQGYESKVRCHIAPGIGALRLDALTPWHLDRWLAGMADDGSSAANVAATWRVARAALRQAWRWRIIPTDPTAGVAPPTVPTHQPDVLPAGQVAALLDAFVGHTIEPAIVVAVGAGLRRSEVCGLTWADVDLDAGTVTVARGMHEAPGDARHVEPPKTSRSARTVTLPRWAVERLRPWRAIGAAPLAADRGGRPIVPSSLSRQYRQRVAAAGLPPVRFRDLRHTHATLALAAGVDVVTVSRRLGHGTVTTTDRFYLRPGAEADVAAAEALDRLMPGDAERSS